MVIVVVFVVNLVKIVQWNVYMGSNQLLKSFDWGTGLVKAILKAGGSKLAECQDTKFLSLLLCLERDRANTKVYNKP